MVARIKAAVAAEEVRKLTGRIRRKHLQLAEAGELSGGGHRFELVGLNRPPSSRAPRSMSCQ